MQNNVSNHKVEKEFQSKLHTFVAKRLQLEKQTAVRVLQKPCWDLCVKNRIQLPMSSLNSQKSTKRRLAPQF